MERFHDVAAISQEAARAALGAAKAHENTVAILTGSLESAHAGIRGGHAAQRALVEENLALAARVGELLSANTEHEVHVAEAQARAAERNLAAKRTLELIATAKELGTKALSAHAALKLPPAAADQLAAKLRETIKKVSPDTMASLVADCGKSTVEELVKLAFNQSD